MSARKAGPQPDVSHEPPDAVGDFARTMREAILLAAAGAFAVGLVWGFILALLIAC